MSERPPIPTRKPPDRWSGRKTLLFIIGASLVLWLLIAIVVYLI